MTAEIDWKALRAEILDTFTPGPAINEVADFAGRKQTIQRLQDIVAERARHAIIFGERGVGKTSLANIFYKDLHGLTRKIRDITVNADTMDSFDSLWRKVFRRIKWPKQEHALDVYYTGEIEPDHVYLELTRFPPNDAPIIIIDEYDRIQDDACRVTMTDLIKALSQAPNNPTIILVGVAENITQLVRDHGSISRNLVQVPMKRMNNEEIRDVISTRVKRLRMRILDDALWRITYFSAGLPFYAHSLGKYSALTAVDRRSTQIHEGTVLASLSACMADVDYTIQESYTRATEKIYRKGNIFAQVVAACALTETNDLGQFAAADVEQPLSAIMGQPMAVTAFSFHLNEMSGTARGKVLRKTGSRRTFQYQFVEPAMQPYIIMKSLKEEIVSKEVFDRFYVTRQRKLSI
jgi:GTPase SAR1 family protein